jgi:F0F1-type ATP synthase gamma subunit
VVGNTGAQYVANTAYFDRCEFMNFPEDTPSHTELWSLVQRFRSYDTVTVYYPRFKNPFQQVPSAVDVNATPDVSLDREPENFIAEPSLPMIHDFFLTQIKWLIFKRLLLETELSRVAARMTKMHSAEESSEEMIDDLEGRVRREERERRDVQLFESIIGLRQWRKLHQQQ